MINDRIKFWLRFGADATVMVGIVLVVIQIRQNTNAVIAANSTAVTDESLVFFQAGLDNQVTAKAIQKVAAKEELSVLERSQYARLQYLNFRAFENAFLQYQRGYYPQAEWERIRRIIQRILADDSIVRSEVNQMRGWDSHQNSSASLNESLPSGIERQDANTGVLISRQQWRP